MHWSSKAYLFPFTVEHKIWKADSRKMEDNDDQPIPFINKRNKNFTNTRNKNSKRLVYNGRKYLELPYVKFNIKENQGYCSGKLIQLIQLKTYTTQ